MSRHSILGIAVLGLVLASGCRHAPKVSESAPANALNYYARCNLKVLKGYQITWVNWQATPEHIPVGTPLQVWGGAEIWKLRDPASGRNYSLNAGTAGIPYLEKFVTTTPALPPTSSGTAANIRDAVARVGMTKNQVYAAMGPPTTAGAQSTRGMTYEKIMATDTWVWRRKRFGKNIGVTFAPGTGQVSGTEGIWK